MNFINSVSQISLVPAKVSVVTPAGTITVNGVTSSGVSSDGYNIYVFPYATTQNYSISYQLTTSVTTQILMVGGGGSTDQGHYAGGMYPGGGGAGGYLAQAVNLIGTNSFNIYVGKGGVGGGSYDANRFTNWQGKDTSMQFIGNIPSGMQIIAYGGGYGVDPNKNFNPRTTQNGGNGGSGGGGCGGKWSTAFTVGGPGAGGIAVYGQGYDGSPGDLNSTLGGGGGGAGGVGKINSVGGNAVLCTLPGISNFTGIISPFTIALNTVAFSGGGSGGKASNNVRSGGLSAATSIGCNGVDGTGGGAGSPSVTVAGGKGGDGVCIIAIPLVY